MASLNVLFNILTALFAILAFITLKPFLDILFSTEQVIFDVTKADSFIESIQYTFYKIVNERIESGGKKEGLILVSLIITANFFLKNLFRYLSLYVIAPVRFGIERELRFSVFTKLLQLPISWFSTQNKGDIISRASNDIAEIQWSVLQSIETAVRSPISIIGSLLVMLYISPALTLFTFILIGFVAVIIGGIAKSLKSTSQKAQESLGEVVSTIEQSLSNLMVIKSFNAYQFAQSNFDKKNRAYAHLMRRIMQRKDLSSPLTEFLGISVVVVLLLYGGNLVFEGQFSASTFVLFITMFYNVIDPAKSFSNAYFSIQKGSAAIERIQFILDTESEIEPSTSIKDTIHFSNSISFHDLDFQYDEASPVLENIQFDLKKGQKLAIVGPSGAGKSSLISLLLRLYEPSSGEIQIDGNPIDKIDLASYRNLFAYIPQKNTLFDTSIRHNITLGDPSFTDTQLADMIRTANLTDLIDSKKDALESLVGDDGFSLSGGQKQRVTIARALIRQRPILIMDEATSSLDSQSETWIQQSLLSLKDRTMIIIAHRLSTIQHCDQIIVLNQGKIVGKGDHQSLMEGCPTYANLVKLQQLDM